MASYIELVRQDVSYHESSEDISSWPPFVSQFVQSLQNELKLPRWLESDHVPYTNERVLDLLRQLRISDDASRDALWDDTIQIDDDDSQQRLHAVFNTCLADCARIQAVLKAEQATGDPYPKESFLAILIRNAMSNADPGLCTLDDVPVILPRHFSGEPIQILKYMTKYFLASLIISICEEMPVEEDDSDTEHQPSDDEGGYELSNYSPPTMSEFLDVCERTVIHEEEEEEEEGALSPQFEAHFLARPRGPSSAAPPSTCHIPVLCMADEDQLPVMVSSLLYQRRVWRISDPLVGVEFSKYDTIIRLYVGWLEDDVSSDRVLPRVHLAEIRTPVTLDLSSPSVALAVSRLLCGLEPHISGVRNTIKESAGAIVSEIASHSSLFWRIDTERPQQNSCPDLTRETITQWAGHQQHLEYEDTRTMAQRKKADTLSLLGSTKPDRSSEQSTSVRTSVTSFPIPPEGNCSPKALEIREAHEETDSFTSLPPAFSCSEFAATSEKEDHRVFRWMFDRRVVPQSIPSDLQFREEYKAMTGFIWPKTWRSREDLPLVDTTLEPYVKELLESVVALEARPGAVNRVPVNEFPVDLRILEQNFSAIFRASQQSRGKELRGNMCEASWHLVHDRFLSDLFIRLVQRSEGDAACTLTDQSISLIKETPVRPTLETTLRLPRSNFVEYHIQENLRASFIELLSRRSMDLSNWVLDRGGTRSQCFQELANNAYVLSQWSSWEDITQTETTRSTISMLRRLPSTGRCDALGRLLVELPNTSLNDINDFHLVVRTARETSPPGGTIKGKSSAKKPRAGTHFSGDGPSTNMTGDSLTAVDASTDAATMTDGTRYDISSSSISSFSPPSRGERITSTDPTNVLASRVQKPLTGADKAHLELPILAVVYKKASDNDANPGTNQLRMYLTSSVKFLQAVGITNVPVYGVQTDGPVVVLPAAILRDDGFVYMFERLVERLDISTAIGAWHYATILCRLAHNHARVLGRKFEEAKEELMTHLRREGTETAEGWTIEQQMTKLTAEGIAKSST